METERTFFYDTYALFEIFKGNKNYLNYISDIGIVTTKLNLMELYYGLFVEFGINVAEFYYNKYKEFCADASDNTIKAAMQFKAQHKKRNLSYVDCVGYAFANEMKIKFLTGDKEFKDMPNVEFVK